MDGMGNVVERAVKKHGTHASALIDILRDVQGELGYIPDEASALVAESLSISKIDVDGVVSFYHFFSRDHRGKYTVYLNNSAVAVMKGREAVARAFEKAAGCLFGTTTFDAQIGLYDTSDIGMNDQEPAALINGIVFTNLTPEKAKDLVFQMKAGKNVASMVKESGEGRNRSDLIRAMVKNNIRKHGQVVFVPYEAGSGIRKALAMTPEEVIDEVKKSNLRGRGGAGFPTGMKWDFTRNAKGKKAYIICNGDEGEPGTFKDRVILTERTEMLFDGMAVAGYAIGAAEGILYLRAEYEYLLKHLESVRDSMRKNNLLGKHIAGRRGFNFDITIKLGAGAYICGEESALIASAEGKRGEPRNRPPFPPQSGYFGHPTSVNNVESLCAVARIMVQSAVWFTKMGTSQSFGTKVLSLSGDCARPGIYEVEFGATLQSLLDEAGGSDAVAVQVGGPSGTCVGRKDFGKKISFEELATGGSIIIIGPDRDLLDIAHNFMNFFVEESCGWCTPCRAGNMILKKKLEKIMAGKGTGSDLNEMEQWCRIVKATSRCGLGQTSPNPIASTIENFREVYEAKLQKGVDFATEFDLDKAVQEYCRTAGRKPDVEIY